MPTTVTLTRDYAYDAYKAANLNSTIIDASEAHWIVSNMGDDINRYPIVIDNSSDILLQGGTISGEVPLEMDRVDAYINSAAIFIWDTDGAVVREHIAAYL